MEDTFCATRCIEEVSAGGEGIPPTFVSLRGRQAMSAPILAGGITGPLCYYKAIVRGLTLGDEAGEHLPSVLLSYSY